MIWIKRNIRFWSKTFFFFTSERCNQENDFMRKPEALSAENTIKKRKKKRGIDFYYVFPNRLGENSEDDF